MPRHVSPAVPTVLLVDSAYDDRTIYAEYLRRHGFHTVEIDDTADGLALGVTADVIVTGIRVAGAFDGVELVRRLRDGNGTHDTPIIVLTACAFEPDQQRALAAGCDTCLTKPCPPDRLVSEIRAVLTTGMPTAKPTHARMNDLNRQRHLS
jgi:two-component system cell cycle response regulator DivK